MNWREQAACRGVAPGVFHPSPPPKGDPRQALACCRRCPVIVECARQALEAGQRRGVVAGVWLSGDTAGVAILRDLAVGRGGHARCVKCWRLLGVMASGRTCQLCGFAEIPV